MASIDSTALRRCKHIWPFGLKLRGFRHTLSAMRLFPALLKLLLMTALAFDLGGGAAAVRLMLDQAQPVADSSSASEEVLPCHGNNDSPPLLAAPHTHGDSECGALDCDCGCALTSPLMTMPDVMSGCPAPALHRLALAGGRLHEDFALPGLRPPIHS